MRIEERGTLNFQREEGRKGRQRGGCCSFLQRPPGCSCSVECGEQWRGSQNVKISIKGGDKQRVDERKRREFLAVHLFLTNGSTTMDNQLEFNGR